MKGINMGHDQLVDIVSGPQGWGLHFYEDGKTGYVAPALDDIEIQGIGADGSVAEMILRKGADASSVKIDGDLSAAARIRVHVMHGDHFHKREVDGPAAATVASSVTLADGAVVEASRPSASRVVLVWSNGAAPAPSEVVVEAVTPEPTPGQIADLIAVKGSDAASVAASGKVAEAAFVRFTCRGETFQVAV